MIGYRLKECGFRIDMDERDYLVAHGHQSRLPCPTLYILSIDVDASEKCADCKDTALRIASPTSFAMSL